MSDIPNKLAFCCLPVLPTIFSDELSYLDVLSKMRDYINKMIDAIKQQDEDIANIQKQIDKVDPSKYIQTSGGTLTGPLFFLDQNSVVKNADGTFTVQSNNPLVIKTGQTAAVNATDGVEIRSGGTVLVTGNDGVSILDKSSAGVAVYEGNTAIAGNIEINGPMTFGNVDVDMHNARTKVAEPVEDENPATKKYVDAHDVVTCGYIKVAVDDFNPKVNVLSENLIPKGELGGYYVDNAGNLWHAIQVVVGGFTLQNLNINVLANAEFVKNTGTTSVKNINVNDTGNSAYQAATNVFVHGGTDVDITAGKGTVGIEGPIVDIHAGRHVNIDTGDGGDINIGATGNSITLTGSTIQRTGDPFADNEIARLVDIARNIKALFNTFTDAAEHAIDFRVIMIESSAGAPIANITAPVFMAFAEAERGSRNGIAIDSAGVFYTVTHNYSTKSFMMTKQTPNGSGGYITVAVDDTKPKVNVLSENLIPKGELGGYYVDNAGNLWHAIQVVVGGFTLQNLNINVLANAEFVKNTGTTSVKNINVNDTGNSAYQAATNVFVHGGTDVDITAGKGTVGIEGPIVDIHAGQHVNIDTGDGGSVVIGGAKSAVDMGNAVSVMVPTPLKGIEAANKHYVDNLIGPRMKMLKRITSQAPYLGIPGDDFANYTEANIFIQASPDSTANEVWIGTILLQGGSITDSHVVSIDATTGTQQLIVPEKFLVTSSGMIINGLSLAAGRGCYFVIPS